MRLRAMKNVKYLRKIFMVMEIIKLGKSLITDQNIKSTSQ